MKLILTFLDKAPGSVQREAASVRSLRPVLWLCLC